VKPGDVVYWPCMAVEMSRRRINGDQPLLNVEAAS
jgi:hypothetical protein